MDSPLGTLSSSNTSCHPSSTLHTPMTPIKIEDVEIFGTSSMPVDGCGGGGRPPFPRKKKKKRRNVSTNLQYGIISLGIKVLLMMIL
jgi:hypothetical protein